MADAALMKKLNQTLMERLRSTKADLDAATARIEALEAANAARESAAATPPAARVDQPSAAPLTPAPPVSALPPTSPASTSTSIPVCDDRPTPPPGPRFSPDEACECASAAAGKPSLLQAFARAVHALLARLVAAFRVLTGAATATVESERMPLLPVRPRVSC
jgi:hypothetical protein